MLVHQIFLRPTNTELMNYGSYIHFQSIDQVKFVNSYLYAGQTIATWSTMTEFWRSSLQNPLPLLMQNKNYRLNIRYSSVPANRLYIKIIFYDSYKKRIFQKVFKQSENIFCVPKNGIHYKIELINGGLDSFVFHQLEISLINNEHLPYLIQDSDLQITDFIHPDELDSTLRIVFTEPRLACVHTFDFDQIIKAKNIIQITNTRALAQFYLLKGVLDRRIIKTFEQLIKDYEVQRIVLVGYGPISNFACLAYKEQFSKLPIKVFLSRQNTHHFPLDYHTINGFDAFRKKQIILKEAVYYYGKLSDTTIMPDLNFESQLFSCPAWNE